jgi:Domain of unknown function (DUF4390)
MRVSANSNTFIALLFLLLPIWVIANNTAVTIRNIETSSWSEDYLVSADIDYQLSKKATEALRNGVPLFWTYQLKVEEQRDYLWNKTVADKTVLYRIQYHALLNMYRVKNENNGKIDNFSTLQAALDLLSTVRDFPLVEKSKILADTSYIGKMKIHFERDALPLPLRPVAYLNPQWQLSSDWYTWPLKK